MFAAHILSIVEAVSVIDCSLGHHKITAIFKPIENILIVVPLYDCVVSTAVGENYLNLFGSKWPLA